MSNNHLRKWREYKGLGLDDMGWLLGIDPKTLNVWETAGGLALARCRAYGRALQVDRRLIEAGPPPVLDPAEQREIKEIAGQLADLIARNVKKSPMWRRLEGKGTGSFHTGGPVTIERDCNVPPESWPTVIVVRDHTKCHDPVNLPDKAPLHLIPADAKAMTALALGDGADKYGDFGWQGEGRPVTDHLAAAERHMDQHRAGVTRDAESGLPPLAHAAARMLIALALDLRAGDWFASVDGDPADSDPAAGPDDGGAG